MAKKSFSRVATVAEKAPVTRKLAVVPKRKADEVVNLERVDLADRENWLRALDMCQANNAQPLNNLLHEIETYQGQIDQALQTAQAQSTIYAYAIGSRLDVIEEKNLYKEKDYDNLTAFIKGGEVKRPNGSPITTRQVWAYRRVTRGLKEFLQIAESIRDGKPLSNDLQGQLENLGQQVNQDIVESFLDSYADSIAGVLELGVSKLEQVYRLPESVALTGLLAGKLPLEEDIIEVHEVSFSQLRKAISTHEKQRKSNSTSKRTSKVTKADRMLDNLNKAVEELDALVLSDLQLQRLSALRDAIERILS
ncbi:MAG: hypothetical protein KTR27_14180 [Leptolyngbyaceae cyanobacterium MAG.088]|nr:hypothetical protein [Leptolyngbyaceae cyanobacterium MAG.088]